MTEYAVIDTETTGLRSTKTNRIVEVAVVRLDSQFNEIARWETLVNPKRDIGRTDIHHITAGEVLEAPEFNAIAGELWHHIEGAITIGHNVSFDIRFIKAEFQRAGWDLEPWKGTCTMQAAGRLGLPLKLEDCCEEVGIDHPSAHRALADTVATSKLISLFADELDIRWSDRLVDKNLNDIERIHRGMARENIKLPTGIGTLSIKYTAPVSDVDDLLSKPKSMEYLDALDGVLEDRNIDEEEKRELQNLAAKAQFSEDELASLHHAYFSAIHTEYLHDEQITEDEERDLSRIAQLLGIEDWRSLPNIDSGLSLHAEDFTGCLVCFTGDSSCSRKGEKLSKDKMKRLAEQHGLIVKSGVSKKLDLLVVADPDSQSGKAKRARELGIRIVRDRQFWRMIGVQVD